MKKNILLIPVLTVALSLSVFARSERVNQVPNGSKNGCFTCHNSASGGSRNSFGMAIQNGFLSGGKVTWNATLAALDSDNDGFTNGQELQDASGSWAIGQSQPGDASLVTNPGNPNSFPTGIREDYLRSLYSLEVRYSGFDGNEMTIAYSTKVAGNLKLSLFNVNGVKVRDLYSGFSPDGYYEIQWNGRTNYGSTAESGMYFVVLEASGITISEKAVLVR